ncbi:BON domain-containing protein [Cereibacter azotoformans]|uniref:BON domain-containing protein n=1 Tax=Cereibacter azotoformans TaxID=43057 RepID=UPI000C6DED87|nr:BON domain-containing protein [Cereibacter azotoformans]
MAHSRFDPRQRGWSDDDTHRGYREDQGEEQRGGRRSGRDERDRFRDRFDARYQDRGQEDQGGGRDRWREGSGMDAASGYGFGAAGFDPRDRDQRRGGYGASDRDHDRGYDPYSERGSQDERSWGYGPQMGREWDGRGRSSSERTGRGGPRFHDSAGERGFMERAADEVMSWVGDEDASHRREADHRGKGPRGYQRSDERIHGDVNDRLSDDPRVDASDIEVSVASGEVTLSGHVSSKIEKRRAEDCADSVSGVRHVQNNLRVRDAMGGSGTGSGSGAGTLGGATTGQSGSGLSGPGGTDSGLSDDRPGGSRNTQA